MHSQQAVIDRETLVRRHNVEQRTIDPRSPISVGNREFCFTMDLTGLQSLPARYPVAARDGLPPGTLLGTQSQWGWHSIPPGQDYTLAGSTVLYDSPRGPVPYVDMVGGIVDGRDTGASDSEPGCGPTRTGWTWGGSASSCRRAETRSWQRTTSPTPARSLTSGPARPPAISGCRDIR